MRRSSRAHGPHFHLTESLTTELGLTAKRLLGDHRVRAGGTGVDLVVNQVVQLVFDGATEQEITGLLQYGHPTRDGEMLVDTDGKATLFDGPQEYQ
jgi:hypothetical protein